MIQVRTADKKIKVANSRPLDDHIAHTVNE